MAPARVVENWVLSKFIGEGGFGKVWLGYHAKFYCMRVIKEIPLGGKGSEDVKNEVHALRTLHGPNIVHMVDAFENNGSMFIVMEYCRGGDLWQYLNARGSVDEDTCRYLLCQLAEGLKVLRQHNIVHRDLKPSNLLLSDDGPAPTLKIADFGIAAQVEPEGLPPSYCGTVPYSAPEMQRGPYGAEADLWSVGVIMYELLTGVSPFTGENYYDLMESVKKDKVKLPDSVAMKLTPGCRHLLHSLLRRNPAKRISHDDFFNHPFFAGKEASAAMIEDGMYEDEEEEEEEEEGEIYTEYEEDIVNQDFDFIYNEDGYELYEEYEDSGEKTTSRRPFIEIYVDEYEQGEVLDGEHYVSRAGAVAPEKRQPDAMEKVAATAVAALPGPSGFILPPPLRYLVMLRQEMLQKSGKTGEATGGARAAVADTDDQLGAGLSMEKWSAATGQQAAVQDEQAEQEEELLESEVDSVFVHLQAKATEQEDHGADKRVKAKMVAGAETAATAALPANQSGSNLPLTLRYLVKLRHEMLQKNVDGAAAGMDCAAATVRYDVKVAARPAAAGQQMGAPGIHVVKAEGYMCKHSPKLEPELPCATAADGAARGCRSFRLQHRLRGTVLRYCQQQVKALQHGCAVMYAHGIPAAVVQPVASRRRRAVRRFL